MILHYNFIVHIFQNSKNNDYKNCTFLFWHVVPTTLPEDSYLNFWKMSQVNSYIYKTI